MTRHQESLPMEHAAGGPTVPAAVLRVPVLAVRRLREWLEVLPESLRVPADALAARPAKSLRPLLVAAAAEFGDPDAARTVDRAALVELLHLASLLHDDVIDRAPLRRGAPSAYVEHGAEPAMLAGLGCFAVVGARARRLGTAENRLVAEIAAQLAQGELHDIERAYDTGVRVEDYVELAERKTGALFGLACTLGAMAGRVDQETTRALGSFGVHLGVAFQVLDDCLDLRRTADEGKPLGTDLLLGLFGAPTLYALAADHDGRLATLLLTPGLRVSDLPEVMTMVEERDGLSAALALARRHHERALACLTPLTAAPAAVLAAVSAPRWPA